jgi:hypothetical protein
MLHPLYLIILPRSSDTKAALVYKPYFTTYPFIFLEKEKAAADTYHH